MLETLLKFRLLRNFLEHLFEEHLRLAGSKNVHETVLGQLPRSEIVFHSTLILTLTLNQTLTLTGGQFSSEAIVRHPRKVKIC